jgi:hypothetical protein
VNLCTQAIGIKSAEENRRFISEGLELCLSKGLTAVQTNDINSLVNYTRMLESNGGRAGGDLPIRVYLTPSFEEITKEGKWLDSGLKLPTQMTLSLRTRDRKWSPPPTEAFFDE